MQNSTANPAQLAVLFCRQLLNGYQETLTHAFLSLTILVIAWVVLEYLNFNLKSWKYFDQSALLLKSV